MNNMDNLYEYDLFICYSRADKSDYIDPLIKALEACGINIWLDDSQIAWGDSIIEEIERGMRTSKYVLLCLSKNFLERSWPNRERSATLAYQFTSGVKRLLPLILDSKEKVLEQYSFLSDLACKEHDGSGNWYDIASEVSQLLLGRDESNLTTSIAVTIESVHTERTIHLGNISLRRTVGWLAKKSQEEFGLKDAVSVGVDVTVHFRYALIDTRVKEIWEEMCSHEKSELYALTYDENEVKSAFSNDIRLEDLGVRDRITFHLYPIQIELRGMLPYASS